MKTTIFAVFVMFLVVTTAHAQQAQSDSSTNTQAMTPISGIDDAALAGSARASKLIGSKVYKGDTSIGQIEDVLADLGHSTVTAVILSVGGFLGIGDKLVAVPVNQIKVGPEAKFTTDLTKEQLANAPRPSTSPSSNSQGVGRDRRSRDFWIGEVGFEARGSGPRVLHEVH